MSTFLFSYDYDCRYIDEVRDVKLQKARDIARQIVLDNAITKKYPRNGGYSWADPIFIFKEGKAGDIEQVGRCNVLMWGGGWSAVWYPHRAKPTARDRAGYRINPDGSLRMD